MRCHPLSALSTIAAALLGTFATPLAPRWGRMKVKHSWSAVPKNWERMGHPQTETTIDLHLALKSHHEDALTDTLYEVSNPKHSRYGAYLSKGQVADLVAPHPDTLDLVGSWLKHYGVPTSSVSTTLGGNWLVVINVPLSQANEMLGASYELYQHVETNDTVIRTICYSLPEDLHGHIQTVVPTTYFASARTEGMKVRISAAVEAGIETEPGVLVTGLSSRDLGEYIEPSFLRWLYKTSGYVPVAADRNMVGIAGYGEQYPSPQDLATFMKAYRPDGSDAIFTVEKVNGGEYDPSNPGIEANLDIQYSEVMAYPARHVFYSTGGSQLTTDPYLDWLKFVIDQETVPQTISTSFGGYEHGVPADQAVNICFLFAQLGLRGVSILFASGNSGVGPGEEECTFTEESSGNTHVKFLPVFPATCPYVTSVGGTTGGMTSENPEIAAGLSGGGFSNIFARPTYQESAVSTFLEIIGTTNTGNYNPAGRGYPDISAQALKLIFVIGGKYGIISGTSAAAPTVAGIISLLNDYLISKGEAPLGFLNPWLYDEFYPGLNDIKSGSNPGCGTDGFPAIIGWDPVTGMGTPDFIKLVKIIDNRPKNSNN